MRTELQRIAAQPRHDLADASRAATRDPARDATRHRTPSRGRTVPIGPVRNGGPATSRQPAAVSGYQPARAGRPAGAPVRADRTPPATVRPRQHPNRKFEHSNKPSMVVVGALLLVAFVVGLVLWVTMSNDTTKGLGATETTQGVVDIQLPKQASTLPPVAAAVVRTFDPDGDGQEHDELTGLATDKDLGTAWTTVCYDSQYLGGKHGVGLVLDLGAAHAGTFTAAIGSAPYQVQLFGAGEGQQPTSYSAWGAAVNKFSGATATSISYTFTTPVRYVLVSFQEIARDKACTKNPYRGAIQEMGFTA